MGNTDASGGTWAVVPLKSPARAKSRLAGVLTPEQRRILFFELATRVITALQATPGIDVVAVATASMEVAAFARARGTALLLQQREAGTGPALVAAVQQLLPRQLTSLLMIAGDLPLVSRQALERVLAAHSMAPGVVIVPDRHRRGTNVLFCTPPQAVRPCFGAHSLRRHLQAAASCGASVQVLECAELALDLDDADDLQLLQGSSPERPWPEGLHVVPNAEGAGAPAGPTSH